MTADNYTVFNALTDIIAAPGKALDQVRSRTSWLWWPLLISLILGVLSSIYYTTWVDFDWLVEETIRGLPPGSPPEAAGQVRDFMQPTTTMLFSVVSIVVVTFLIYLIQSVYLHLANKLTTGAEISLGQWFSFSAWTAFVGVFNAILVFVVILMADNNQLAQQDLLPLSLNSLFIHAAPGEPWFTWGNSLTLFNLWTLVLMSIGYARWTGAGIVKSTIIATLPWVAIFGVWAITLL